MKLTAILLASLFAFAVQANQPEAATADAKPAHAKAHKAKKVKKGAKEEKAPEMAPAAVPAATPAPATPEAKH